MKLRLNAVALAAAALALGQSAWADEAAAKKWVDAEFQPSTLNKDQQMAEMKWFIDAAAKLKAKGVTQVSVVSETLTTHEYESKTLAKAFEEITGIKVKHDIIQEGDVVEKLQTSMPSGAVVKLVPMKSFRSSPGLVYSFHGPAIASVSAIAVP